MTTRTIFALMAGLPLALAAPAASAGSALDDAIAAGGERLDADAIAGHFAGMTATFVSADGSKQFLVYYGEGNEAAGRLIGGDWSDSGLYGITDADTICLSWSASDAPRLRCMTVVVIDGVVHKFNADGSLSGTVAKFEEGRML